MRAEKNRKSSLDRGESENFLARLTNGQLYIQAYLAVNSEGMYDETIFNRSVHYTIQDDGV